MWNNVECITSIKTNGISLSLRKEKKGNKTDLSYQIVDDTFKFREAVLMGTNLKF
jgi:hypothetical protein